MKKTFLMYFIPSFILMGTHFAYAENVEKNPDNAVTIVVKNEFKKRIRQVLADENKPHIVKVCRAQNRKVCTESVSLKKNEAHEFTIRADDVKFKMDFDSNGFLKPESLEVYASDVVCGHENDADKQFYPSTKIPYDGSTVQMYPRTMEVKIHRMVGHVYWTHAYCSIEYRDKGAQSKFAIVNFAEIMGFCRDTDKFESRTGIYPYSGFLPDKHALAEGVWNKDMFAIEKVRFNKHLLGKHDFCEKIFHEMLLAELKVNKEKYSDLQKRFTDVKSFLELHKMYNSVSAFFSDSYSDVLNKGLQNMMISQHPDHLPALPKNLDSLEPKEQKPILDEYLSKAQDIVNKMEALKLQINISVALDATPGFFDSFKE